MDKTPVEVKRIVTLRTVAQGSRKVLRDLKKLRESTINRTTKGN